MPLFYQYRPVYASDLRSSGGLLTGTIFPMPLHKVRRGFVRKREKDAGWVAQARFEPPRTVKVVASNADEGDD
jgi:hypothetical protein